MKRNGTCCADVEPVLPLLVPADAVEAHDDELRRLLAGLQLLRDEAVGECDAVLRPARSGRPAPTLPVRGRRCGTASWPADGFGWARRRGAELDASEVGGPAVTKLVTVSSAACRARTASRQQGQPDNRDR